MQSMRREIIVTNGHGTVPISALIDSPHSHSFSSLQLHISLFNFHRSVQLPEGEESLLLCSSRIWVQFYLFIYFFPSPKLVFILWVLLILLCSSRTWVRFDFFYFLSFAEAGSHFISFAHIALFFTHLGPVLIFFFLCRSWFSLLTDIFYPLLLLYFQICFLFTDLLRSFSFYIPSVGDRVFCCGKGVKRRARETTRVGLVTVLYPRFAIDFVGLSEWQKGECLNWKTHWHIPPKQLTKQSYELFELESWELS